VKLPAGQDPRYYKGRLQRLSSPALMAWLLEQDSYCNATFGQPSLAKARKELAAHLDKIKGKIEPAAPAGAEKGKTR
jgi:hypothetical protein